MQSSRLLVKTSKRILAKDNALLITMAKITHLTLEKTSPLGQKKNVSS